MNSQWPGRVLCPVDFSKTSAAALRHAHMLSQAVQGDLTVLHTHSWEAPAYFTEAQVGELDRQLRQSMGAADGALKQFIARECPECAARRLILDAPPVDGILRAVKDINAELLVMGTHGRSGLNRFLLGSVTERVLRETSIPVLTVRDEEDVVGQAARIRKILCPVNDTPLARQAFRTAAGLAAAFGAELTALHVEEPHPGGAVPEVCRWLDEDQRAACKVEEIRRSGDAAEETLRLARDMDAGLVVLGVGHRLFHDTTVLGTTSIRLIRHSPVPVLSVIGPVRR